MKKLIIVLMLLISANIFAQSYIDGATVTVNKYFSGSGKTLGLYVPNKTNLKPHLLIENKGDDTLFVAFSDASSATGLPDTVKGHTYPILPGEQRPFPAVESGKFYLKGGANWTTGGTAVYWINYGTEIYKPEGKDFKTNEEHNFTADQSFDSTVTFGDSSVFKKAEYIIGTGTHRPITYYIYDDAVGKPLAFNGQVGVREWNGGYNLNYKNGLHWYDDTSFAASYITLNAGVDSIFCWQWMPHGYGNQPSQPDAWNLSGNTTPFRVNSQGFMGVIGGITSNFKTQGNPTYGTSTAYNYIDTNKFNFIGIGGKSSFDWKVGIGTVFPAATLHQLNKANVPATTNYSALSDHIIQDDGVSDRAQTEYRSPNGSLIAFGNQSTYNLGYIQYINSSGIMFINASTAVDINSIRENGTALTSKYSQLATTNTFTDNMKVPRIAVNQSGLSPIPYVAVAIAVGDSNLYGLNVVGLNNTVRNSQAQATDSSSISAGLTQWTKKPIIQARSNDGTNALSLDSTKTLRVGFDIYSGNDVIVSNGRYFGAASNSNGTLGVLLNATSDGVARLRNFGLSADASLQLSTLILTGVPTYADNSAALSGGLTANKIYKTSTGTLMIVY